MLNASVIPFTNNHLDKVCFTLKLFLIGFLIGCQAPPPSLLELHAPNGHLEMRIFKKTSEVSYQLFYKNRLIIDSTESKIWSSDLIAEILFFPVEEGKQTLNKSIISFLAEDGLSSDLKITLSDAGMLWQISEGCGASIIHEVLKEEVTIKALSDDLQCKDYSSGTETSVVTSPMIIIFPEGMVAVAGDNSFETEITSADSRKLRWKQNFCTENAELKLGFKLGNNYDELVNNSWSAWESAVMSGDASNFALENFLCWPLFYQLYYLQDNIDPLKLSGISGAGKLAAYVLLPSIIQKEEVTAGMIMQLPSLQFVQDLPNQWGQVKVVSYQDNDHLVLARKEFSGKDWFVGGINLGDEKTISIPLDFLETSQPYMAATYSDDLTTHLSRRPELVAIDRRIVTNQDQLSFRCIQQGGLALSFVAVQKAPGK